MPRSTKATTTDPLSRFFGRLGDIALDTTSRLAPDLIARQLDLPIQQPIAESPTFTSTALQPNASLNSVIDGLQNNLTQGKVFGVDKSVVTVAALVALGIGTVFVAKKVL